MTNSTEITNENIDDVALAELAADPEYARERAAGRTLAYLPGMAGQ